MADLRWRDLSDGASSARRHSHHRGICGYQLGGRFHRRINGCNGKRRRRVSDGWTGDCPVAIPNPNGGAYTFDFVIYMVNQSQWILVDADMPSATTPYIVSGQAIVSSGTYGAGPLNGAYMFGMQGYDFFAPGGDATIGVFQAASAGTVSNASFFENDAGNYSSATSGTGT